MSNDFSNYKSNSQFTPEQRKFQEKFRKSVEELVELRNLHNEEYTKKMVADIIEQMMKSGDLRSVVRHDSNAFTVVYLPYEGMAELQTENAELKKQLDQFREAARGLHKLMEELEGPYERD